MKDTKAPGRPKTSKLSREEQVRLAGERYRAKLAERRRSRLSVVLSPKACTELYQRTGETEGAQHGVEVIRIMEVLADARQAKREKRDWKEILAMLA